MATHNTVRAARASSRTTATMPAHLQTRHDFHGTGLIRKSHALPLTGAQRDSTGKTSDWARSADIGGSLGSVIRDKRWSDTVQNRG